METIWLCGFAFLAGFVDSVVGGGGLIQLPALFLFLPQPLGDVLPAVFGTNKLSSICGTGMAVMRYSRRVSINWRSLLPAAVAAFVFSFLGARVVTLLKPEVLKPLVIVLLIGAATYIHWRRDLGNLHLPKLAAHCERQWGLVVGSVIGFYDGFFGPGTGSFLMVIFIGLFGFDFLNAAASTKVINFAANLSAVIYFALTDNIYYRHALPMGICNLLGALLGTRMAILRGNQFVRGLFLLVVAAMIARFAWDVLRR